MMPAERSDGRSSSPGHEFREHTAETIMWVRADSLAGLLRESVRALAELANAEATGGEVVVEQVTVEAPDPTALLVDWINEIVYLAERDHWLPVDAEVTLDGHTAVAEVRGRSVDEAPSFVKAATYHGVGVQEGKDGFEAEVVLDI